MESHKNPEQPKQKKFYESPIGRFEVRVFKRIVAKDIGVGDRAFIHTESGNRYMIRHSASRNEALLVYDERNGTFEAGSGHPFLTRTETIGEVGRPFEYFGISDEILGTGNVATSTRVTEIEVRIGLEEAIRKFSAEGQAVSFGGIAEAMIDKTRGKL